MNRGLLFLFTVLPLWACSDDETSADDDGSGGGATCAAATTLFSLRDVTPAAGSSVPNDAIVHGFTIVNAPASVTQFTLIFGAEHTAGTADTANVVFTILQMGTDLRYEAMPLTWQSAPAEVDVSVGEKFRTPDNCVYAFPEPLFRYAITEGAAGGAGGAGGSGGGPGLGGSGGG